MAVPKFKVDKLSKGSGTLALEKATNESNTIILLTFRNASGTLLFQAQVTKNLSKLLKHTRPKPYKVQRIVTVVEKKDSGKHCIVRCLVTVSVAARVVPTREGLRGVQEGLR